MIGNNNMSPEFQGNPQETFNLHEHLSKRQILFKKLSTILRSRITQFAIIGVLGANAGVAATYHFKDGVPNTPQGIVRDIESLPSSWQRLINPEQSFGGGKSGGAGASGTWAEVKPQKK